MTIVPLIAVTIDNRLWGFAKVGDFIVPCYAENMEWYAATSGFPLTLGMYLLPLIQHIKLSEVIREAQFLASQRNDTVLAGDDSIVPSPGPPKKEQIN